MNTCAQPGVLQDDDRLLPATVPHCGHVLPRRRAAALPVAAFLLLLLLFAASPRGRPGGRPSATGVWVPRALVCAAAPAERGGSEMMASPRDETL